MSIFELHTPDVTKSEHPTTARLKVVGVGGAGGNAVQRMIEANLEGVEFIAVNTDYQALSANPAPVKIQIGKETTRGLGAGGRPDIGRQAIEEDIDEVMEHLKDADLIFVTAGMGGGTGTGAAPEIARRAKAQGILTIAIVSTPFPWEGKRRMEHALEGVAELTAGAADTVIVVPNARISEVVEVGTSFKDALRKADEVLLNATRGISGIITRRGEINTDFADIRTIMGEGGKAILGCGFGSGSERAQIAARNAVESPLLDNVSLYNATRILVNVRGADGITINEVGEAVELIRKNAHPEAELIFGAEFDDSMGDQIAVTVIATGFEDSTSTPLSAKPQSTIGLAATESVDVVSESAHPVALVEKKHTLEPRKQGFWSKVWRAAKGEDEDELIKTNPSVPRLERSDELPPYLQIDN